MLKLPWPQLLFRVQFDDQLLVDGLRYFSPLRKVEELSGKVGTVPLDPRVLAGVGNAVLNHLQALGSLADSYSLTGFDNSGRDVAYLTVEYDVAVRYKLTCCRARRCDTHAVHDVVQTGLKEHQQVLTCASLHPAGLRICVTELSLEHAIGVFHLLLLLQLVAVLGYLLAFLGQSVLSGRIVFLFEILIRTVDRPNLRAIFVFGPVYLAII